MSVHELQGRQLEAEIAKRRFDHRIEARPSPRTGRHLVDAGRLLDALVYDRLVLGAQRYLSFAEAGLL
jgi:hypothetical protein